MITVLAVLIVAGVLVVSRLLRRLRCLERELAEAWYWAQFYKVLAWRWHDRSTIAAGLEPYWDWAEDGAYPALERPAASGPQKGARA